MRLRRSAPPLLSARRADNARLLRRLVLAPTTALVESYDDASPAEIVDSVLAAPPLVPDVPDGDDDFWAPTAWWIEQMLHPDAGLHERLVWFWHGHLTSSVHKASPRSMLRQHELLRGGAVGNFRELLRSITLDPAMLWWLDGSGSSADAPNENYARELMEVFALGSESGAYTERDVRNGARALAGYWVEGDENADPWVNFEQDGALRGTVEFLGRRVGNVDDVVDAVCDHSVCAVHLSRALCTHFVGPEPERELVEQVARTLAEQDLDIAPAVHTMLRSDALLERAPQRPRSALEWFLALERLVGGGSDIWPLEQLGQMPMAPPNVAGWPDLDRWTSTGTLLTKGQIALDASWDTDTLDRDDPVGDVLRRAVLYEVSASTRSALDELATGAAGRREQSTLLHAAVAMCPEFSTI